MTRTKASILQCRALFDMDGAYSVHVDIATFK